MKRKCSGELWIIRSDIYYLVPFTQLQIPVNWQIGSYGLQEDLSFKAILLIKYTCEIIEFREDYLLPHNIVSSVKIVNALNEFLAEHGTRLVSVKILFQDCFFFGNICDRASFMLPTFETAITSDQLQVSWKIKGWRNFIEETEVP